MSPAPADVTIESVPIVVPSTTDDYFVLYASFGAGADEVEYPVAVVAGADGTTSLAENVEALPQERYRVERYLISDPADVDGDCVDDITELNSPATMSPLNPSPPIAASNGLVSVTDRAAFEAVTLDRVDLRYTKFLLIGFDTARPGIYFMNTNAFSTHQEFASAIGVDLGENVSGQLVWTERLHGSHGGKSAYYFFMEGLIDFRPPVVERIHALLAATMPVIDDDLFAYIPTTYLTSARQYLSALRDSRVGVLFDDDIGGGRTFESYSQGVGFGRLRVLDPGERPHPREVILVEVLPKELPPIAGIISSVPQTPLSHVNLRASQNGIPNAYVLNAHGNSEVDDLIDEFVRYEVTDTSWSIRSATRAEVDAHYAALRPAAAQFPRRDLSVTAITPLSDIGFADWDAFGVKAANVAELAKLGFPAGTVPDGFAIPFYFYDEFMKTNELYSSIETMLADVDFQSDFDVQDDMLKQLRDDIKDATTPAWMIDALTAMHAEYADGASLRYRSSTNNEDLPGFNGAGLYDSKTQHFDETIEDGIDKSLKQVFASLWNFGAFTEREFHRVDHGAVAMGVLVHPNYSDELANGVAVSHDLMQGLDSHYYVNTQVGEDLVTNPDAYSLPEELLLTAADPIVLATSNQKRSGRLIMSDAQMTQLHGHLSEIHDHFAGLYLPATNERFAIEIEFKITSDDLLAIKQARPWVFAPDIVTKPKPPPPQISTSGGSSVAREPSSAVVIVANGWRPADIGVAAALSARTDESAVVYTDGDRLSNAARDLLEDVLPSGVIVVGGPAAVSNQVLATARRVSESESVERISGATRSATAAQAARRILASTGGGRTTFIVANGWSAPDIGLAASLSARTPNSVVLHAQSDDLTEPTRLLLAQYQPDRVVIVGGISAVALNAEAQIRDTAPNAVIERISGATRAATAAGIARRIHGPAESVAADELTVILANGWSAPDIGLAAALSARTPDSIVLYTAARMLSADAEAALHDYQPSRIVLIGGTGAISDEVERRARGIVPDATARRHSGTTRTHTAASVARRILSNR